MRNSPPSRIATAVCVAGIPLSLLCFWLANKGVPRHLAQQLLGPDPVRSSGSAPPYMRWDLRTMFLMLMVCGASTVGLSVQVVKWLRSRKGGTE